MIKEVQRELRAVLEGVREEITRDAPMIGHTWSIQFALKKISSPAQLYYAVTRNALHVLYLEECLSQTAATPASRWCFARDDVAAWYTNAHDTSVASPYFVTNLSDTLPVLTNANDKDYSHNGVRAMLSTEAVSELCNLFSNNLWGEANAPAWNGVSITGSFLLAASAFNGAAMEIVLKDNSMNMSSFLKEWNSNDNDTAVSSNGAVSSDGAVSSNGSAVAAAKRSAKKTQYGVVVRMSWTGRGNNVTTKIITPASMSYYTEMNVMKAAAKHVDYTVLSKNSIAYVVVETNGPEPDCSYYVTQSTELELYKLRDDNAVKQPLLQTGIAYDSSFPNYLYSKTNPSVYAELNQLGEIMSDVQNIRHNKKVRDLWSLYYTALYNTDIDLITPFCSDAVFDAKAAAIAGHIGRADVQVEKVGGTDAYRWRITHVAGKHPPIDLYRNSFGSIFRYHLPVVRAAHAVSGIGSGGPAVNGNCSSSYVYLSNAVSILTGYCQDRRWCKCASSAVKVLNTYASRFYRMVVNKTESPIIKAYHEETDTVRKYHIDENEIIGCDSNESTYDPLVIQWQFARLDKPRTIKDHIKSLEE
jgi:hypothetical protein